MRAFDVNDTAHVAVLFQWYFTISNDERKYLFHSHLHNLAPFLQHFISRTADLMFEIDATGIYIAVWTVPMADAAEFSCWVRADKRHSPSVWRELQLGYKAALEVYPTLVGATRQPMFHVEHLKLGYRFAGRLNAVSKDGPLFLYELTREAWQQRHITAKRVRDLKRAKRAGQPPASVPNGSAGVESNGLEEHGELERQPWVQRALARLGVN